MKQDEAVELTGWIQGAWGRYLDPRGEQAWLRFFGELDVELTIIAFERLRVSEERMPTMHTFRQAYVAAERDRRADQPRKEQRRSEMPEWVKAWQLARADGDQRAFSQQPGFDALEQMPPGDQAAYLERAASMTVAQVAEYVSQQAKVGATVSPLDAARAAIAEPEPEVPLADGVE